MSTIGHSNDMTHCIYLVDKDLEPERHTGCAHLFMNAEQASELATYLGEWATKSPCIAVTLFTGKRKKGNPVLGDAIYD